MAEDQARVMRADCVTDWYEIDHAYWKRYEYHRITHRRLWCDGSGEPDYARFERLGVEIRPPHTTGKYVLLALQSDQFYTRWTSLTLRDYVEKMRRNVRRLGRRNLRLRWKPLGRMRHQRPLAEDLAGAWIVVTHSSAVALEALAFGLPVIVTERTFCAGRLATPWDQLEEPYRPSTEARRELFARVAGCQYTLDEMRSGEAWERLSGNRRRTDGAGAGAEAPDAGADPGTPAGAALASALAGVEHRPPG